MSESMLSRRAVLRSFTAAAVGTLDVGRRLAAGEDDPLDGVPIVDTHFHLVNTRLPGLPDYPAPDETVPLAPFDPVQQPDGAKKLARAIEAKCKEAGIGSALCMPRHEVSDADPLGVKEIEAVAALVRGPKLHPVGFAHPERFDRDHLERIETVLKRGRIKALKVYLAYLPYLPSHIGYRPYYKLAAKYKLPVIFHTGDPYSNKAKVKYAHPLAVDEVAVDYPDTHFVLAHFGNPWVMDAAEVVFKNKNVWADLSGILVGNQALFEKMTKTGFLDRTVKRIKEGIEFAETPERFLFGSDWPLAPLKAYRDFIRQLFAADELRGVFRDNARTLFGV